MRGNLVLFLAGVFVASSGFGAIPKTGWVESGIKARHLNAQAPAAPKPRDEVRQIRASNVIVAGTPTTKGYEKKVLTAALKVVGRVKGTTSYKMTYHGSMTTQRVQSQEYYQFAQMANGSPMDGYGLRVMLVKGLKGYAVRLVDYHYAPEPEERANLKSNPHFLMADASDLVRSLQGEVKGDVFKDKTVYRFIKGEWRLVRDIQFEGGAQAVVVDVATGESWNEDRFHNAESGKVVAKGNLVGAPIANAPLTDLPVALLPLKLEGGKTISTDAVGDFTLDPARAAVKLSAVLSGQFVKVTTESGTALKLESQVDPLHPGTVEFPVALANEMELAQSNTYYHVTRVHEWLNSRGIKAPGMDKAVGGVANIDDNCNAYYTGGAIHFFKSGGDVDAMCVNTAYDSVIYHEYGHLVDDALGGIEDGGLSEGWGDVVSMYLLGIPEIGKDFFVKHSSGRTMIRNGENTYQYPADGDDEVHSLGQAWMGFAWDLRKALIAKYGAEKGAQLSEELVLPSLVSNAVDIPTAVRETLVRDDDDGNLKNGTPDLAEITAAAKLHSLDQFLKL